MSYITNAEFLQRFDARLIGDLVQDANSRTSSANLLVDANLSAILADASGWIESACFVGERYSAADLTGLGPNSLAFLKRLVADIALVLLCQRRGFSYKDKFPLLEESMKTLDRLRLGERVFNVSEVKDKGNPTSDVISYATLEGQNLISMHNRVFPHRDTILGQT